MHLRQALELEYHFPIDWDTRVALDSLRRIKRIAEAEEATEGASTLTGQARAAEIFEQFRSLMEDEF